jgi:hypothetical protein
MRRSRQWHSFLSRTSSVSQAIVGSNSSPRLIILRVKNERPRWWNSNDNYMQKIWKANIEDVDSETSMYIIWAVICIVFVFPNIWTWPIINMIPLEAILL